MPGPDIDTYWMAYTDLLALRAKGVWTEKDFWDHYNRSGRAEGRRIGSAADAPPDWSDWLYFRDWNDDFAWWWRMGVLPTGAHSALTGQNRGLDFGCLSRNPRIRDLSAMSPEARLQVFAHARDFPGSGPLRDIARGSLRWGPREGGHALTLADLAAARFPAGLDHLVVLPWLQVGGAERVGVWHDGAARAAGHAAAILLADDPEIAPHYAHLADRVVSLPGLFRERFGGEFRNLPLEARREALVATVEALRPQVLHVIHSFLGYGALAHRPSAARLRAAAGRIHVSAFCPHIHPDGVEDGYFRYIPDIIDGVDRVIFDNSWYESELSARFGLPAEKSAVLRYPVARIEPLDPGAAPGGNRVLWASRLDAQKNPGVLRRIAERLPQLEFLVYGQEVLGDVTVNWAEMPANVHRRGPFLTPEELPLGEVIAFLYTSRFDGMPNILLEVGAHGIPIVTPEVGGVADFLGRTWMFYTAGPDDVESYVAHLAMLHRSPELRRFAGGLLVERARAERTVAAFNAAAAALLPPPREPRP